jgi:beta-lactamase class A
MALPVSRTPVPGGPSERAPWAFLLAVVAATGAFIYLLAVVAAHTAPGATKTGSGTDRPAGEMAGSLGAVATSAGEQATAMEAAIRAVLTPEEAAVTGVAVMTPGGEWLGGLNPDRAGYAASTFKLPILLEAERRVSAGVLSYNDRVPVTEEARAEDLGTIDRLPVAPDGTVSLGEALAAMVTISDNASAVALLRLLGPAEIDASLRALGAELFSVNDPGLPVTARDLALVVAAIARGQGMSAVQRNHALDLLAAQEIRAGISGALDGIPGIRRIGNKTGAWPGVTRDVALVETDRGAYVVAVMAEGDWNWELVRRVARAVHHQVTSR